MLITPLSLSPLFLFSPTIQAIEIKVYPDLHFLCILNGFILLYSLLPIILLQLWSNCLASQWNQYFKILAIGPYPRNSHGHDLSNSIFLLSPLSLFTLNSCILTTEVHAAFTWCYIFFLWYHLYSNSQCSLRYLLSVTTHTESKKSNCGYFSLSRLKCIGKQP